MLSRNERLLIVDDIKENRAILMRRLARQGFNVTEADGGTAALDLIAREPFDVVLLDIMMPDLNGIDVLRRVRETHSPAHLPVIMVTANNERHRDGAGAAAGRERLHYQAGRFPRRHGPDRGPARAQAGAAGSGG